MPSKYGKHMNFKARQIETTDIIDVQCAPYIFEIWITIYFPAFKTCYCQCLVKFRQKESTVYQHTLRTENWTLVKMRRSKQKEYTLPFCKTLQLIPLLFKGILKVKVSPIVSLTAIVAVELQCTVLKLFQYKHEFYNLT